MSEVEITFTREGVSGIVAAGSYLIDAARQFGVRPVDVCDQATGVHHCAMIITTGNSLLSSPTAVEEAFFQENPAEKGERLACQTRIERQGEVVIMTKSKETEPETATDKEREEKYRKEFAELPLEKKIYELVHFEAIALSETISFVVNSPFKVAEKAMDVFAEFGFKRESEQKAAKRPEEHRENGSNADQPNDVDKETENRKKKDSANTK